MDNKRERQLVVALVVVGVVLSFAYSLLIAGQILLWLSVVWTISLLYLLWRFVRAHERIAGALENGE